MDLSWERITLIVGFCIGAVKYSVPVAKWIAEQVAAYRKDRREIVAIQNTESVEMQRLENESDEATWRRMEIILEKKDKEIERLEKEVEQSRNTSSLSGATIQGMYREFNDLGRDISSLEMRIVREMPYPDLLQSVEIVKQRHAALGSKMP